MIPRPGSALSKIKKQHQNLLVNVVNKQNEKKIPTKEEFVKKRDFVGAITLLEHEKMLNKDNILNQLWLGYCYFHNGDYE
jgi:intraflagellar transport protein 56